MARRRVVVQTSAPVTVPDRLERCVIDDWLLDDEEPEPSWYRSDQERAEQLWAWRAMNAQRRWQAARAAFASDRGIELPPPVSWVPSVAVRA